MPARLICNKTLEQKFKVPVVDGWLAIGKIVQMNAHFYYACLLEPVAHSIGIVHKLCCLALQTVNQFQSLVNWNFVAHHLYPCGVQCKGSSLLFKNETNS